MSMNDINIIWSIGFTLQNKLVRQNTKLLQNLIIVHILQQFFIFSVIYVTAKNNFFASEK
jgi:hypothetical protein